MPYSLKHCKTIRTGIHKGNPLVPLGKQRIGAVADGCVMSCLPQGGYRGPNWKGPLNALCFLSVITERKCPRGTSARGFIFLKRGKRGRPAAPPVFLHCTRQPEADRKRLIDAPHRACIKAAHFFLKALFVNGAHLLKQHY